MKSLSKTIKLAVLSFLATMLSVIPVSAQLSLEKTLTTGNIKPGDEITFRLTYYNTGAQYQNNVIVKDVIPSGFEYVSSFPAAQVVGNTIIWTGAEVPDFVKLSSGSGALYVTFKVGQKIHTDPDNPTRDMRHLNPKIPPALDAEISTQTILNSATIQSDYVTTPVASNSESATTTQICTAIVSQASNGGFKSDTGDSYTYLVTLTNTGNVWNQYSLSTMDPPIPYTSQDPSLPDVTIYQPLISTLMLLDGTVIYERAAGATTGTTYSKTPWLAPGETFSLLMKLEAPSRD